MRRWMALAILDIASISCMLYEAIAGNAITDASSVQHNAPSVTYYYNPYIRADCANISHIFERAFASLYCAVWFGFLFFLGSCLHKIDKWRDFSNYSTRKL